MYLLNLKTLEVKVVKGSLLVDDVVETANHFRAVDYVIASADVLVCGLRRFGHEKLAVEVKARGGCAQSLKTLIKSEHYEDIGWGIKLHGGNVGWENRVLTLPCFTAFRLRRFLSEHGDDECFMRAGRPNVFW